MKVWHRLGGRCGANAYQLTMCARAHPPLLCAPSASFARHPLSSSTFLIQFLHPLSSFTLLIHTPHPLPLSKQRPCRAAQHCVALCQSL